MLICFRSAGHVWCRMATGHPSIYHSWTVWKNVHASGRRDLCLPPGVTCRGRCVTEEVQVVHPLVKGCQKCFLAPGLLGGHN